MNRGLIGLIVGMSSIVIGTFVGLFIPFPKGILVQIGCTVVGIGFQYTIYSWKKGKKP